MCREACGAYETAECVSEYAMPWMKCNNSISSGEKVIWIQQTTTYITMPTHMFIAQCSLLIPAAMLLNWRESPQKHYNYSFYPNVRELAATRSEHNVIKGEEISSRHCFLFSTLQVYPYETNSNMNTTFIFLGLFRDATEEAELFASLTYTTHTHTHLRHIRIVIMLFVVWFECNTEYLFAKRFV